MKMVEFTRLDGESVWIAPTWVISVMKVLPGEMAAGAENATEIKVSGGMHVVKETIEVVMMLLDS